jgi:6-pyruvoyltetrahydropterin/6-carboxytetrahydropterin synthase
MEVFKEFSFDSAHWLPNVAPGHKCGRMHGHTYRVRLSVIGDINLETGFVIDFGDLKGLVKPVIDELDHQVLNDWITNPTCENLAMYFAERVLGLDVVEVWETPTSGCRYVVPR